MVQAMEQASKHMVRSTLLHGGGVIAPKSPALSTKPLFSLCIVWNRNTTRREVMAAPDALKVADSESVFDFLIGKHLMAIQTPVWPANLLNMMILGTSPINDLTDGLGIVSLNSASTTCSSIFPKTSLHDVSNLLCSLYLQKNKRSKSFVS